MRLTVSATRRRLGEIIGVVQDPNECVVMTRHGKPVAAVVSMANLRRIWQIEDEEDRGVIKHPLNKFPHEVGLKWSCKTVQRAKMYPTLKTGYKNDQETQFFGQV